MTGRLVLLPLTLTGANAFVQRHARHHPPMVGVPSAGRQGKDLPQGRNSTGHRSCLPLFASDFDALAPEAVDSMTAGQCDGMCGV
jgi:hypothetical protein